MRSGFKCSAPTECGSAAAHFLIGKAFEPIPDFKMAAILWAQSAVRYNGLLGGRIALAHIDALLLYATFRNSSRTTRRNSASNDCLSMCSRSA